MKFRSNARYGEAPESGTIFELKDNRLRIKIHRIIHINGTWFLSCAPLGFSQYNLREDDFNNAVEKAKNIIGQEIRKLNDEYCKIANDYAVEIER